MARQMTSGAVGSVASGGTDNRIVLASTTDRQREIRRARRHTIIVKLARVALPVTVVACGGIYLAAMLGIGRQLSVEPRGGRIEIGSLQSISREGIGMSNPRYQGFGQDGSRYHVTAALAVTDISRKAPLKLETIKGELVQADGGITYLNATRGTMDTLTSVLVLTEGIRIDTDRGMSARLDRATVESKLGRITSDRPVLVTLPAGEVRANSMELLQKTREIAFDNGVATRLTPRPPAAKSPPGEPAVRAPEPNPALATKPAKGRSASAAPSMFSASGAPVDITSVRLVVKDTEKTAEFLGNVKAAQGDATLAADTLHVTYSGSELPGTAKPSKQSSARDTASPTPELESTAAVRSEAASAARGTETASPGVAGPGASKRPPAEAGRIKLITARDNVVLTRGTERVTSPLAVFDAEAELATLSGGVTVKSGDDRRVVSQQAQLDSKADTALLTGDVVLTQGQNELRGARLFLNRRAQTLEMTPAAPSGRISARLQPPPANAKARQKPANADQALLPGGIAFRPTPGAPIAIDASRLDVDDKAHTATFRGDVVAVQGEFRLNSAELIATYLGGGQGLGLGTAVVGQSATAAGATAPARLKRIQARTNVVVRTGENRSATGDWADFDVAANTVTLGGKVVLKEGRQILNGDTLVIDLATGLSQLKRTPGEATVAGVVRPDPARGQCGGRMCAVFYPKDIEEAQKRAAGERRAGAAKSPSADRSPTTSGWSTDTRAPRQNE